MMHSIRPSSRFGFAAALLLSLALIGGCETVDKADKPAKLAKIKQTVPLQKAWTASVGGAKPKLRLGLGVAVDGDRVFIAGHNGQVRALSLKTGKQLWQINTRLPLSGGPGAGDGLVVVGASHGDLVALDAQTCALPISSTARCCRPQPLRAITLCCVPLMAVCMRCAPAMARRSGRSNSRCRGCLCVARPHLC
jgi:hypothetical protein